MNKRQNRDEQTDVMELARLIAGLSEDQRKHLMKVVRLAAMEDLGSGDTLLERLLSSKPISKRYLKYEREIRRAQRAKRRGRR